MENKTLKILLWALTIAILGGCLWALYATGFFQAMGSPERMGDYIAAPRPGPTSPISAYSSCPW